MNKVVLALSTDAHRQLWSHLLSDRRAEQAAFAHVQGHAENGLDLFRLVDWAPVPADGYAARTGYYFELTDEARAAAIKRARDLGSSLVEFHSHLGPWPAAFSASDWFGFQEFVPHVWWRLKGRPYLAVVAAETTFDGLAWIAGPTEAQRLDALLVDGAVLEPTGLSRLTPNVYDE